MRKLISFPFWRLTNGNASQLYRRLAEVFGGILTNVIGTTPADDIIRNSVFPKINAFLSISEKFSNSVRQTVGMATTRKLTPLENERDRTTNMAARTISNGMSSSTPDIVDAANEIDVIWRKYGRITHRQQDEQTQITEKLLRDLNEPVNQEFIQIIPGLASVLESLGQINERFSSLFDHRIRQHEEITRGLVADLRVQADNSIIELVEAINAVTVLFDESPVLSSTIDVINNILEQARLDLSARMRGIAVRNANRENAQNQEEIHPDDENDIDHEEHEDGTEEQIPDKN